MTDVNNKYYIYGTNIVPIVQGQASQYVMSYGDESPKFDIEGIS